MLEALLLVLLVGAGVPFVLYLFVRSETDRTRTLSRADAESYARERSAERYGDGANRDRD
jgi:hypothetical protein